MTLFTLKGVLLIRVISHKYLHVGRILLHHESFFAILTTGIPNCLEHLR